MEIDVTMKSFQYDFVRQIIQTFSFNPLTRSFQTKYLLVVLYLSDVYIWEQINIRFIYNQHELVAWQAAAI